MRLPLKGRYVLLKNFNYNMLKIVLCQRQKKKFTPSLNYLIIIFK